MFGCVRMHRAVSWPLCRDAGIQLIVCIFANFATNQMPKACKASKLGGNVMASLPWASGTKLFHSKTFTSIAAICLMSHRIWLWRLDAHLTGDVITWSRCANGLKSVKSNLKPSASKKSLEGTSFYPLANWQLLHQNCGMCHCAHMHRSVRAAALFRDGYVVALVSYSKNDLTICPTFLVVPKI